MQGRNGATKLAQVWTCVLAVSLFVSGAALADARGDAKRHFRDGMQMIAAGQLERGIAELKQAYAIKPHPDVLYDIAKAYVDLGNIPEALVYFRQYVATDPEDKDQVTSVMQRLQAAITPGQNGNAAPAQVPPSGAQNAEAQRLIAQLQALIAAQNKAPAPAVGPVKPGAAPAPAKPAGNAEDEMFEESTISAETRATAQQ
ncbi:MAG TPA: tetratricopeptide repeat protein, partial [Myxococcales bacterium]|nr:tetratricopeptide repeat protein [Myxococcales bacterium]